MKKIMILICLSLCALTLTAFAAQASHVAKQSVTAATNLPNKQSKPNTKAPTQQIACDQHATNAGSKNSQADCKASTKILSGGAIAAITTGAVVVVGAVATGAGLGVRGAKQAAKSQAVQDLKTQLRKDTGDYTEEEEIENILTPENNSGKAAETATDEYGNPVEEGVEGFANTGTDLTTTAGDSILDIL